MHGFVRLLITGAVIIMSSKYFLLIQELWSVLSHYVFLLGSELALLIHSFGVFYISYNLNLSPMLSVYVFFVRKQKNCFNSWRSLNPNHGYQDWKMYTYAERSSQDALVHSFPSFQQRHTWIRLSWW